jgi:hypothetical protein
MGGGVFEELCRGTTMNMGEVAPHGRTLLQHETSYVHRDDTIQGPVWVRCTIIHRGDIWG